MAFLELDCSSVEEEDVQCTADILHEGVDVFGIPEHVVDNDFRAVGFREIIG